MVATSPIPKPIEEKTGHDTPPERSVANQMAHNPFWPIRDDGRIDFPTRERF